jgi:urease accessory protein
MRWPSRVPVAAAVFFLIPSVAAAHTAFVALGSFWAGALHPLSALDEIGLIVGLAIWAGLQQRRDMFLIGSAFAGCLAAALFIGLTDRHFSGEIPIAVLMVAVGLAGALRLSLGTGPLLAAAAVAGAALGGASADGVAGVSLGLFALGTAVATASLLSYGLMASGRAGAEWTRIALRAGASWIAAIGLMMAALESARLFGRL